MEYAWGVTFCFVEYSVIGRHGAFLSVGHIGGLYDCLELVMVPVDVWVLGQNHNQLTINEALTKGIVKSVICAHFKDFLTFCPTDLVVKLDPHLVY